MKRHRPKPKRKAKLTDESPFPPWGKHAGEKMANIPADYFLFLDREGYVPSGPLREYIDENMDAFLLEVKEFEDD